MTASLIVDGPIARLTLERPAALNALERYTEALDALEQAIRIDPAYGPAFAALGLTYKKLGRVPEAIAALRRLVKAARRLFEEPLPKTRKPELPEGARMIRSNA